MEDMGNWRDLETGETIYREAGETRETWDTEETWGDMGGQGD